MERYEEVYGDLIEMANDGKFDVIAHGCNCWCTMGAGIALQIRTRWPNVTKYSLESDDFKGWINKLGQIEYESHMTDADKWLVIVNAYTQFQYGRAGVHTDYEALALCLRKINVEFKDAKIGLPKIGAGLAGGDWVVIKQIIQRELKDCNVTVVKYRGK